MHDKFIADSWYSFGDLAGRNDSFRWRCARCGKVYTFDENERGPWAKHAAEDICTADCNGFSDLICAECAEKHFTKCEGYGCHSYVPTEEVYWIHSTPFCERCAEGEKESILKKLSRAM